jgi:hypothetical protein
VTPEQKQKIDSLSRFEMAKIGRFSPSGNPLLQDEAGAYFAQRFKDLGGFSPEISKELGWE